MGEMRRVDVSKLMEKLRRSMRGFPDPLDWVLALFHVAGGSLPSEAHVQKALFLASLHVGELGDLIEFKAYRKGPWSEEVSDVLEYAKLNRLILKTGDSLTLTEFGARRAEEVASRLNENHRRILADIAGFVSRMSVDELLLYIYTVYGFSEKSDAVERLLRRRRELAVSLLLKGLVSTDLAARIAGEPLPRFIEYLKSIGVKPFVAEVNDIGGLEKT